MSDEDKNKQIRDMLKDIEVPELVFKELHISVVFECEERPGQNFGDLALRADWHGLPTVRDLVRLQERCKKHIEERHKCKVKDLLLLGIIYVR